MRKQITSMLWGELELKLFYVYDNYSGEARDIRIKFFRRHPFQPDIIFK